MSSSPPQDGAPSSFNPSGFDVRPSDASSLPSHPYGAGQSLPYGGGHKRAVGSRAEVMHGTAHHTSGGLTKKHLKYNKWGRIVSVAKSAKAKKEKRLAKAGYTAKKGKFGAVKIHKKTAKHGRK